MANFAKYETRSKINKGARLDLVDPDTGESAGDYLEIRYSLADDYAAAREVVERSEAIAGCDAVGSVERNAKLIAPLIAGWTFDDEFTPENVFAFLCGSPHLHGPIIEAATLEGKLYSTPSRISANGPAQNSHSTASRKGRKTV